MKTVILILLTLMWGGGFCAVDILTAQPDSIAWETLRVSPVELPVLRPDGTAKTVFEVADLAGDVVVSQEVAAADDTVRWAPFAGAAPAADEFYSLRLDFYAAGANRPFTNATARLAVVRGAFGDGVDVFTTTNAPGWDETPVKGVVARDGKWVPFRFCFPPWRADRPGQITVSEAGTNVTSCPLTFKSEACRVYAR